MAAVKPAYVALGQRKAPNIFCLLHDGPGLTVGHAHLLGCALEGACFANAPQQLRHTGTKGPRLLKYPYGYLAMQRHPLFSFHPVSLPGVILLFE